MFPFLVLAPTQPSLPPCRIYIFGATGDLVSKRAVRDALVQLAETHALESERNPVVLLAPSTQSGAVYAEKFRAGDPDSLPITAAGFEAFRKLAHLDAENARLIGVNVKNLSDYEALENDLKDENAIFFGALPPKLYGDLLDNLRQSGLSNARDDGFRRILLEKPFGMNSGEAGVLSEKLERDFDPDQVLLIDHFLAYPGMTNMLRFRCDPAVDEALTSEYVDHFEIKILESIKSNDRPYFRETGLVTDMVQSHGLQVFATMGLEPGADLPSARRQVVESIQIEPDSVRRGQFEGFNDPAQGAPPQAAPTDAETYLSFRFKIDSPRWHDVPFRFVNAKGLDHKRSGVDIHLRSLPEKLAAQWHTRADQPAMIHTTMNPISRIWVDLPERTLEIANDPSVPDQLPYTTVLLQAIRGDTSVFATPEESLAGWRVADELTTLMMKYPLLRYPAGSTLEQVENSL